MTNATRMYRIPLVMVCPPCNRQDAWLTMPPLGGEYDVSVLANHVPPPSKSTVGSLSAILKDRTDPSRWGFNSVCPFSASYLTTNPSATRKANGSGKYVSNCCLNMGYIRSTRIRFKNCNESESSTNGKSVVGKFPCRFVVQAIWDATASASSMMALHSASEKMGILDRYNKCPS